MSHSIRLLVICSWGATSGVLCQKINKAAQEKGIPLVAEAIGTSEYPSKLPLCDAILLEPQIGHHKRELQKAADAQAIPLDMVDPVAFATMNGEKVLEQVLALIQRSS
ncbi:PTS sugar transporter subunit IIB [Laceyella putida]|uniref:PTS sugar transporter subunit IIB n=1 Tax=Laceyella putida TaxID=110101 RepID=A0ABW2RFX8_9BACL